MKGTALALLGNSSSLTTTQMFSYRAAVSSVMFWPHSQTEQVGTDRGALCISRPLCHNDIISMSPSTNAYTLEISLSEISSVAVHVASLAPDLCNS